MRQVSSVVVGGRDVALLDFGKMPLPRLRRQVTRGRVTSSPELTKDTKKIAFLN